MIPYISLTTFSVFGITLHVWGILVALGFLAGTVVAMRFAKASEQDANVIADLAVVLVFAGMIGGRLGYVLFYDPAYFALHPVEIVAMWNGGLSMFGGILVAVAAAIWYLRKRKVDVRAYANTVAFGLPVGIMIGRVGCFLIHDHPGTATHFFLGVQYPDGVIRHDLGLYEAIYASVVAVTFLIMQKYRIGHDWYIVVLAVSYGIFRFTSDFLRTPDSRYFGLTPAQYLSALLIAFGIGYALWIQKMQKRGGGDKLERH